MTAKLAAAAALTLALTACGSGGSGTTTTYHEPSASMLPTLKIGQQIAVAVDPHNSPNVGDIVAFHLPFGANQAPPVCGDPGQGAGHPEACDVPTHNKSHFIFIKRVVAGPGDRLRIVNGQVILNGKRVNESRYTRPCGGSPSCNFPRAITIPSGDYFMLGDNRSASDGSRFWGPVPKAWIIGEAQR